MGFRFGSETACDVEEFTGGCGSEAASNVTGLECHPSIQAACPASGESYASFFKWPLTHRLPKHNNAPESLRRVTMLPLSFRPISMA